MDEKSCSRCGKRIPRERLEALPDTEYCRDCSTVRAKTVLDIETDGADPRDLQKGVTNY